MTDRRLLFSLLLLPACEPAVSSGDDPREPDGGEPDKFQSSCRAFYNGYYACYEEYSYASTGSSYESGSTGSYGTGSIEPGEYIDSLCEMAEQYAADYGKPCLGAMEEVFACVSSLDCDVVFDDDSDGAGWVPEPCRAVFEDASNRCPELIPPCGSYGIGFGDGCDVEVSACLDGNTYAVDCYAAGVTQTCSCKINGAVTQDVTISGDFACGDHGWGDEVEDACGFPMGVL